MWPFKKFERHKNCNKCNVELCKMCGSLGGLYGSCSETDVCRSIRIDGWCVKCARADRLAEEKRITDRKRCEELAALVAGGLQAQALYRESPLSHSDVSKHAIAIAKNIMKNYDA